MCCELYLYACLYIYSVSRLFENDSSQPKDNAAPSAATAAREEGAFDNALSSCRSDHKCCATPSQGQAGDSRPHTAM